MQALQQLASIHCGRETFFGIPHWARGLEFDQNCNIINFSLMDVWQIVGNIVEMTLVLAGYLAIVFILVGAFMFITSAGNPDNIKRAKTILFNAMIGLVIAVLAVTIIRFIVGVF